MKMWIQKWTPQMMQKRSAKEKVSKNKHEKEGEKEGALAKVKKGSQSYKLVSYLNHA